MFSCGPGEPSNSFVSRSFAHHSASLQLVAWGFQPLDLVKGYGVYPSNSPSRRFGSKPPNNGGKLTLPLRPGSLCCVFRENLGSATESSRSLRGGSAVGGCGGGDGGGRSFAAAGGEGEDQGGDPALVRCEPAVTHLNWGLFQTYSTYTYTCIYIYIYISTCIYICMYKSYMYI